MALLEARYSVVLLAVATSLSSCMTHRTRPEVYGHRGCRGLLPENTMPSFLQAVEFGVDVIELDVVISKDGQVMVSHEPWMSHRLCTKPDGSAISEAEELALNLFQMDRSEIQAYDCGSVAQAEFPDQEQQSAYKPTLREVVEQSDEHAMMSGVISPGYAIEIKSDPRLYGTHQPLPAEFVRLVLETIDSLGIEDRCVVQSFDPAVLEAVHAERSEIMLSFLVENTDGWKENLKKLSFVPDIYSPHFSLITAKDVEKLHAYNVEVVVWTVNEVADIRRMLELGVEGIISDYPDRVLKILEDGD